jgi:hypothetical protein
MKKAPEITPGPTVGLYRFGPRSYDSAAAAAATIARPTTARTVFAARVVRVIALAANMPELSLQGSRLRMF